MSDFFDSRINGYEQHMMKDIAGASEFYPFTAECLPRDGGARVLDLGCGTGLELDEYFKLNPAASVMAIDLSSEMLRALNAKFAGRDITAVQGSFFDLPLLEGAFDGAVSVEALHHYTKAEKVILYKRLYTSLKSGATFVLTDYFADSDEEEEVFYHTFLTIKELEGLSDSEIYHYDIPLTVAHEIEALREAGFGYVRILKNWGATYTIKAVK